MINKMNKHRKQMAEEFLSQALGIICLLTGEEYVIVKKRHSHNTIHRQSREVPIKCDDVAVYSSMEEWEYIERHKELYKDVMMETHQTLSTMEISENKSSELTGHSDENLDTGAHGEFLQNIQPVETPSDVAADVTGHSDENLDVGVRGEFVQNIELVETSSDVTAGDIDVKTEDLSVTCQLEAPMQDMCDSDNEDKNDVKISRNTEQTENQWLRNITEAADKEILQNNCTGAVKTEVTLNAEQTYDLYVKSQLEVLKQEISDNISTGEFTNCNNPRHGQNPDASFGLLQNQSSHMGNVCSECGKSFTWKSKLITHQKIHTGVKAFPCPECGKCFSLKSTLTNHLKIHTGEKAFPCSECGKCFTLKSNLVAHQKTHTGEKAFSCSECGKWFVQKSNLITHQKTHTGEKEFSCSECGKCFARKATLFDHQKTHTKERAFLCTECGKSFTQKSTLITHKKIHIKGKSNSNILSAEDIDYMLSSWSRSFGANPGPPCTLSSYKEAQYVQNHYHQGI